MFDYLEITYIITHLMMTYHGQNMTKILREMIKYIKIMIVVFRS